MRVRDNVHQAMRAAHTSSYGSTLVPCTLARTLSRTNQGEDIMTVTAWRQLEASLKAAGCTVFRGNDNYFVVNGKTVSFGPNMPQMLARAIAER